ncbi:hypothetical protein JOF56_011607 [Kibdelosporangium banguiense]|uniref:Phage tail protein n=1 Tax=Kibdelosporangium banguiense TaxID=1365924 RepID=A0ABS4U3J7_9PSEU|nr:hypothetical protein [Kibdelosporangium banguiense]MBP2331222.1 hypothetical protein [Kibdelosporangium banguiense]
MPIKKRLTRFNRIQVNTGTEEAPNWVLVRGLSTIELSIEPNEVDTSDFDSEGWDGSVTTHRKWSLSLQGQDGYTGPDNAQIDDPGQAHLKTKGLLTGPEAYTFVRFYRIDNNQGYTGRVTSNYSGTGGEVKSVSPFTCPLTGDGQLSAYTHVP